MTQIVSSISSLPIYAPSAAYAPTNGTDVSAIASAYAESAASSKLDSTAFSTVSGDFLTAETVSSIATAQYGPQPTDVGVTTINGFGLVAKSAATAYSAIWASIAGTDDNLRELTSLADSAAVSAIASSYAESAASSKLDTTAQVVSSTAGDGVYITSINGLGLSGQGGAQIVTSTASALFYSAGQKTGVSAINGSAIIALSATTATQAVSANYADNTYYALSAYFDANGRALTSIGTATGGSVTSPSGTIWVQNGNQIEGTNSAVVLDQTSIGVTSVVHKDPQVNSIGHYGMTSLTYDNLSDSGMNLVFMIAGAYHGDDATVVISGRDNYFNLASASGLIVDGDTSANIPLGTVQSQLSASSDHWINLMYGEDLSGVKAPGYAVTGIGELAWKSAVDNVTNTVSSNSATWGQGGVDSATVSAIASSYAESAVSGKADTSSLSSYALSADVSGVIDTVSSNSASWGGGVDSATVSGIASAYAQSAASSKLDTSAFNSGDFYLTSNPSGFITGVDLTPYQPTSAMSAYATTAYVTSGLSGKENVFSAGTGLEFVQSGSDRVLQVEAPVDIVAGPGIVIDNPDGNTLRVTNVGTAISKTEGTRCGTFNGSPMYIKLFEKAITVNASETIYNFTIDVKVGTDNVTNMWIDPSNSYILYGSAGSNVLPLTYRVWNGREGSIFIAGKNSGSLSFRGIDTAQNPMTAFIAVKYTVSA